MLAFCFPFCFMFILWLAQYNRVQKDLSANHLRIVCLPQRRPLGQVFHIGDPDKIGALAICEIIKVWLY